MNIRGLDFSSAKSSSKRSYVAYGELDGGVLSIVRLESLRTDLSGLVHETGEWVLGVDFPFGLPRIFVEAQAWSQQWEEYAAVACNLPWTGFERLITVYRDDRRPGEKQPARKVDRLARSRSPLMTVMVPVARMFHAGAGVIAGQTCDVLPFRNASTGRTVVEAYPALLVRRLVGSNKYKDGGDEEPRCREVRDTLLRRVVRGDLEQDYGFSTHLESAVLRESLEDARGDALDSVLCLIQAAWAYSNRENGWGIPDSADRTEGWIVDPSLVRRISSGLVLAAIPEGEKLPTPPPRTFNSSETRVRPVFGRLVSTDPTGVTWLAKLLRVVTRNIELGDRLAASLSNLRAGEAFERKLAPPASLLEWCIGHASELVKPRAAEKTSPTTKRKRAELRGELGDEAMRSALDEAQRSLTERGPARAGGQWWAFEGFTSADCCLETDRGLLVIEGKRFEGPSEEVSWIKGRNQIARNLEVAAEVARQSGREYAVLLVGPEGTRGPSDGELRRGWPHLAKDLQDDLLAHYLGTVSWQDVCRATGLNYDDLPVTGSDRA